MQKTTNYDQFKTLEGNRWVDSRHIQKLTKAIQKKNLLKQFPILVTKDFVVIDGQHRLAVAKRLKKPIYYQISEEEMGIEETQIINANTKKWEPIDFVRSYASIGKKDYKILLELMEKYNLSAAMVIRATYKDKNKTNNYKRYSWEELSNVFKEGFFEVDEGKLALFKTFLLQVKDIIPYLEDKNSWRRKDFYPAIQVMLKKVNYEEFIEKLEKISQMRKGEKKIIEPSGSAKEFVRQFEFVINWKLRKEENFINLFSK